MEFDEILSRILGHFDGRHEQMLDIVAEYLSRKTSIYSTDYKKDLLAIFAKYERNDNAERSLLELSEDDELLGNMPELDSVGVIEKSHPEPDVSVLASSICSKVDNSYRDSPDLFDGDSFDIPETQMDPEDDELADDESESKSISKMTDTDDVNVDGKNIDKGNGTSPDRSEDDEDDFVQIIHESNTITEELESQNLFANCPKSNFFAESSRRHSCINNKSNDSISLQSNDISKNLNKTGNNNADFEMSALKWNDSSNASASNSKLLANVLENNDRSASTTPDLEQFIPNEAAEELDNAGELDGDKTPDLSDEEDQEKSTDTTMTKESEKSGTIVEKTPLNGEEKENEERLLNKHEKQKEEAVACEPLAKTKTDSGTVSQIRSYKLNIPEDDELFFQPTQIIPHNSCDYEALTQVVVFPNANNTPEKSRSNETELFKSPMTTNRFKLQMSTKKSTLKQKTMINQDSLHLRKLAIHSKENNKSVQGGNGGSDDDDESIYNKLTQVDMQAQSNLNDGSEAQCQGENIIDDEDSIYMMETQAMPEIFLNTNAPEITSAPHDEEDSIYMMETQPMPEMLENPTRYSIGNDAIFMNMKTQITQSSTPQRESYRISDKKPSKARRISPDTDDDSIAKLIPKVMDESIDRLKISDNQRNKKLKQMWLFVSSDDDSLDEVMSENKTGSVVKKPIYEHILQNKVKEKHSVTHSKTLKKKNATLDESESGERQRTTSNKNKEKSVPINSPVNEITARRSKRQNSRKVSESLDENVAEQKIAKNVQPTKLRRTERATSTASNSSLSETRDGRSSKIKETLKSNIAEQKLAENIQATKLRRTKRTSSTASNSSLSETRSGKSSKIKEQTESKPLLSTEHISRSSKRQHSTRSSVSNDEAHIRSSTVVLKKMKIIPAELRTTKEFAKQQEQKINAGGAEEKLVNKKQTNDRNRMDDSSSDRSTSSTMSYNVSTCSSSSARRSARPTRLHVMFTKVNFDEGIDYRQIVHKMGGKVVEDINTCTILVTNKIVRTCKFLCAMAKGIPIVSTEWLLKVKENRYKCLDTDLFILNDPDAEKRFEFSLKQSLENAREFSIFKDYLVYVTPSVKPPPEEIRDMVQCAGGRCIIQQKELLKNSLELNLNVCVVSAKEDKQLWPSFQKTLKKVQIVTTEPIMLSIMRHRIDFKGYVLAK